MEVDERIDLLERLASLHGNGALTDEEYRAEQIKILSEGPTRETSSPSVTWRQRVGVGLAALIVVTGGVGAAYSLRSSTDSNRDANTAAPLEQAFPDENAADSIADKAAIDANASTAAAIPQQLAPEYLRAVLVCSGPAGGRVPLLACLTADTGPDSAETDGEVRVSGPSGTHSYNFMELQRVGDPAMFQLDNGFSITATKGSDEFLKLRLLIVACGQRLYSDETSNAYASVQASADVVPPAKLTKGCDASNPFVVSSPDESTNNIDVILAD